LSDETHELPEVVAPEVLRDELARITEVVAASDERVEDVSAGSPAAAPASAPEPEAPQAEKPLAAKLRAAKLRADKAQAERAQAAKAEASKAEAAKAEAAKAEAAKAEAAKAEAAKAEAAKAEAAKAEAARAEAARAEAAKAQAEKAKAEKAKAEKAKAEKPKRERKEKPAKEPKPKRERRSLKLSVPRPKVELPKPKLALPKPKLELPKLNLSFARGRRNGHSVKRLVGLHIGASQLAAARVANNGSAELLQLARTSLEPGVVVGGELRDPEKLTEALRAFFKEHDLPREGVRLGVANNRIGVRTFEIVGISDSKQLDNAVRFRAQETLPIPIEEAVLDYQVLSDEIGPDNLSVKQVLLVVAYRESIDRYVDACRKAGIELVGIDLDAFALLRAMSAPRENRTNAALVVVSIGHERSTFAVSNGKTCEFTRVLEWGGHLLGVALARALNVAPSEAESVKRALDLGATTPPSDLTSHLTSEQFDAAKDAARRQIQSFARELASSLQFYQNQPGSLSIGEIVLTGGTSHMGGLATELQQLIGVTVRVGDPLMRVRVGKKAFEEGEHQIGSLATAIGLGIED